MAVSAIVAAPPSGREIDASAVPGRGTATGSPSAASPRQVLYILCAVNFSEAVQGNIIWAFLPFAVERWGHGGEATGLAVGTLASSFYVGQLLTVLFWGMAADRFGRRPVLLAGLLGTAVTMLVFGFSESFTTSVISRFLTGALNGNTAIVKVYLGECSNASTIARNFALLSFTWGLGTTIAPALGGFLADPAAQYQAFAGNALLTRFPYLLPALVAACWSVLTFVFGAVLLTETDAFLRRREQRYVKIDSQLEWGGGAGCGSGGGEGAQSEEKEGDVATGEEAALAGAASRGASGAKEAAPEEEGGDEEEAAPEEKGSGGGGSGVAEGGGEGLSGSEDVRLLLPDGASVSDIVRDRDIAFCIGAYGLLCFGHIIFDELLPVLCKTHQADGGLSFTEAQVGSVQIVAGLTQITFQLCLFPVLAAKFGPVSCFRHSMWPLLGLLFFPAVARITSPALLWVALSAFVVAKTSLTTVAFTSIMLCINNSARGRNLGKVAGLAQALASGVRTVGPAVGGGVFSASLGWGSALGSARLHAAYVLLSVAALLAYLLARRVPPWVNHPPSISPVTGASRETATGDSARVPGADQLASGTVDS